MAGLIYTVIGSQSGSILTNDDLDWQWVGDAWLTGRCCVSLLLYVYGYSANVHVPSFLSQQQDVLSLYSND